MTGEHPDELALLAYVEGDPDDAVGGHVVECAACAARTRDLEAARAALRSTARLEPPPELRDRVLAGLPERPQERRVYVSPMRLATILAPVAALVALAVGLSRFDVESGGGGDAGGGGGGAAETAPALEVQPDEDARGAEAGVAGNPVRRVAGTPEEVATALRSRGFDAEVAGDAVLVRGASTSEVRRALAGRPNGPVTVLSDRD